MTKDPIIDDVRAAREKLFGACNGNLEALLDQLKKQEQQDQSRLVSKNTIQSKQNTGVG